jgi:hypothetical protein
MKRLIGTTVTAVVTVAMSLACTASAALASHTEMRGRWVQTVNRLPTSFNPLTGEITCEGSTSYQGTWAGITHYTFTGKINLLTGDITGKIVEHWSEMSIPQFIQALSAE